MKGEREKTEAKVTSKEEWASVVKENNILIGTQNQRMFKEL
jgi:hypothetical protein